MPRKTGAAQMAAEDYEAAKLMLEAGALVPLEAQRLPKGGWVIVYCGDGEVTPRAMLDHIKLCVRANGKEVCTQLIQWDGGPASLSKSSPYRVFSDSTGIIAEADRYICARIEAVLGLKSGKIGHVGFVPHCTCAMCRKYSVDLWHNFLHSIEGKDTVRQRFNGTFRNHKIIPRLDFTGYPESESPQGAFWSFLLVRNKFEQLAEKRGIV